MEHGFSLAFVGWDCGRGLPEVPPALAKTHQRGREGGDFNMLRAKFRAILTELVEKVSA